MIDRNGLVPNVYDTNATMFMTDEANMRPDLTHSVMYDDPNDFSLEYKQ